MNSEITWACFTAPSNVYLEELDNSTILVVTVVTDVVAIKSARLQDFGKRMNCTKSTDMVCLCDCHSEFLTKFPVIYSNLSRLCRRFLPIYNWLKIPGISISIWEYSSDSYEMKSCRKSVNIHANIIRKITKERRRVLLYPTYIYIGRLQRSANHKNAIIWGRL